MKGNGSTQKNVCCECLPGIAYVLIGIVKGMLWSVSLFYYKPYFLRFW